VAGTGRSGFHDAILTTGRAVDLFQLFCRLFFDSLESRLIRRPQPTCRASETTCAKQATDPLALGD